MILYRLRNGSLTDAAMCMNLINEPLFNIVMWYVLFQSL